MKKLLVLFLTIALAISTLSINCSAIKDNYTGWAKSTSTGNRYYYKNGSKLTGVQVFKNNKYYIFDNKGVYLGKRDYSKKEYSVVFDNSNNVEIKDGNISFSIQINSSFGRNTWDYSGDPQFSLYVYENGKWNNVSLVLDENAVYADYAVAANDDGVMKFTMPLSMFDYEFKAGLYRVKARVAWDNDRDENGSVIFRNVTGEFNLV